MNHSSPTAEAVYAQDQASNPEVSAFVSASAGSGKTKLLTDRLLRLLLAGANPGAIHCLTYTKAAAAEMAVRLQKRLGEWVTTSDETLARDLASLSVEPTPTAQRTARALFGRVLDLPGGMRIGTIHAFCQSLLRRFPLEAQLSPHFELSDERDADHLLNEALEEALATPDMPEQLAIRALAGMVNLQQLLGLIKALYANERAWEAVKTLSSFSYRAQLAQEAGLSVTNLNDLMREAVIVPNESSLRGYIPLLAAQSQKYPTNLAVQTAAWLDLDTAARIKSWDDWKIALLTTTGQPRKLSPLLSKKLFEANPGMAADFEAEQLRLVAVEEQRATLQMVDASTHLITIAKRVLSGFEARKQRAGVLDYGDLIQATRRLLQDPGIGWVRYKLDEGIDHLLLDEVQDTSPSQWDIARQLWDEFFAGQGANQKPRTVFAVGDQKQSIYSFQGADPQGFWRERTKLQRQAVGAGLGFASPSLNVSFRSASPVLELVDQIFRVPPASQGVGDAGPAGWLDHRVAREGQAGCVTLWPVTPQPTPDGTANWHVAQRYQSFTSAKQMLADRLADHIRDQTAGNVWLPARNRPLAPGDVLILVRRRDDFVRALGRALKQRHVPVAGLDRMVLTDEIAVQDLLALCEALLLPEDDLSLAEFLTSPLGGLSDDSLMRLALDRGDTRLFHILQARAGEREDWRAALDFLRQLRARVDFAPPHELLATALGPLGGRARLLARLGPDAAEPIDELLAAALRHASLYPASLQSFLHWLKSSGAEIKREAEAGNTLVRIMTVHGAKGLQAPLVILPDTTSPPRNRNGWLTPNAGLPFWMPPKDAGGTHAASAVADAARLSQEEENRLLYVALTRAEDQLLICGTAPTRGVLPENSWYHAIQAGFSGLAGRREAFAGWDGETQIYETPQHADPKQETSAQTRIPTVPPAWLGMAPLWQPAALPPEPALPRPLAPSRPQDAALGLPPPAGSPAQSLDRFARGKLIHLLLQHLPDLPPTARAAAALSVAAQTPQIDANDAQNIVAGVIALLDNPALAPLFGPHSRAEVPLSGLIGSYVVQGVADRLVVLPDRVIIADYKSNRAHPARVPVMYLRQMSAYRALILQIFPKHVVDCWLIWTEDGTVTPLSAADLADHMPS